MIRLEVKDLIIARDIKIEISLEYFLMDSERFIWSNRKERNELKEEDYFEDSSSNKQKTARRISNTMEMHTSFLKDNFRNSLYENIS